MNKTLVKGENYSVQGNLVKGALVKGTLVNGTLCEVNLVKEKLVRESSNILVKDFSFDLLECAINVLVLIC